MCFFYPFLLELRSLHSNRAGLLWSFSGLVAFTEAPQLDATLCAAAWPTRGETEVERKGYFNKRGASNLRSIYSTYMYIYIYIHLFTLYKIYIEIYYILYVCIDIYIYSYCMKSCTHIKCHVYHVLPLFLAMIGHHVKHPYHADDLHY